MKFLWIWRSVLKSKRSGVMNSRLGYIRLGFVFRALPRCHSVLLGRRMLDQKKREILAFKPLPPSDAVQKQKKKIEDLFGSVLSQFKKKYHPYGNLKFNHLGIFQSLKLRNLTGNILRISLILNFTPNTLGC